MILSEFISRFPDKNRHWNILNFRLYAYTYALSHYERSMRYYFIVLLSFCIEDSVLLFHPNRDSMQGWIYQIGSIYFFPGNNSFPLDTCHGVVIAGRGECNRIPIGHATYFTTTSQFITFNRNITGNYIIILLYTYFYWSTAPICCIYTYSCLLYTSRCRWLLPNPFPRRKRLSWMS